MIVNGARQPPKFDNTTSSAQFLAASVLCVLDKIIYDDVWVESCLLHPGLRSLSFVENTTVLLVLCKKVMNLLRNMMEKIVKTADHDQPVSTPAKIVPIGNALGNGSFQLSSCVSFLGALKRRTRFLHTCLILLQL